MKPEMKDIAKAYLERREALDALEAEHNKRIAQIRKELQMLEGAAHKMLVERGDKSVRTDFGTVFRQKWTKAKVTDPQMLFEWAKKNDRPDIYQKSVNKTVVLQEVERAKEATQEDYEGCPVPGVEIEHGWKCHIRKS